MSTAIASALRALDQYPVSYETTATDTIVEADTVDQIFEAVQAAHQAIPEDRVITSIEIDEDRRRPQDMHQRVASVERELGHPPQQSQTVGRGQQQQSPAGGQPQQVPVGTPSQGAGQKAQGGQFRQGQGPMR